MSDLNPNPAPLPQVSVLRSRVESLLLVSDEAVTPTELARVLSNEDTAVPEAEVRAPSTRSQRSTRHAETASSCVNTMEHSGCTPGVPIRMWWKQSCWMARNSG